MLNLSSIAIAIHAVGALVWVGGMIFAYTVLRPSLGAFEPPQRLSLWSNVFARFFLFVWFAVVALPATGYILVFDHLGGFGSAGMHVHIMHVLGLVMIGLFVTLYFVPYRHFQSAVTSQDWPLAAKHLNTMRHIVGINALLGIVTVIIGSSGRFWG